MEAFNKQILVDWGNLETFGRLVDDGTLVWPPDAKNIRRAHAKGFHLVCLKSLMELKSRLETTKSLFQQNTWGVVCHQTFIKKKGVRHFDKKSGILYEATGKKVCGKYPITRRFLGTLLRQYTPKHGWWDLPQPAKASLAVKLFGTDDADAVDPQLGINLNFLESKKHRKGWSIAYAEMQDYHTV